MKHLRAAWQWIDLYDDMVFSALFIGLGVKIAIIDALPAGLFFFGALGIAIARVHLWKLKAYKYKKDAQMLSQYIQMHETGRVEMYKLSCVRCELINKDKSQAEQQS